MPHTLQRSRAISSSPPSNDPSAGPASKGLSYDHIFIITYGRTGSTLLQGLLNTTDGVLVRGENNNITFNLFEAYEALTVAKDRIGERSIPVNKPWYGLHAVDTDAFVDDLRHTMTRALLSDRAEDDDIKCFGFKEIRHPEMGEKLAAYLEFLTLLFPNPAFIFLSRDLAQVSQSAWWAHEDKDWVYDTLQTYETRARAFAAGRSNCFLIDYSDVTGQTPKLRALFEFLGAPYIQADVDRTLSTPHSYSAKNPEEQG